MKQQEKTTTTAKKKQKTKKQARKGLGCRGQGLRGEWDPRLRTRVTRKGPSWESVWGQVLDSVCPEGSSEG